MPGTTSSSFAAPSLSVAPMSLAAPMAFPMAAPMAAPIAAPMAAPMAVASSASKGQLPIASIGLATTPMRAGVGPSSDRVRLLSNRLEGVSTARPDVAMVTGYPAASAANRVVSERSISRDELLREGRLEENQSSAPIKRY